VDRRWPAVRAALGNLPVGGTGIGTRNSLAQYLAGELSRRIKSGDVTTVEGAFLTPIFTKRIGPQSGQSYW
jgi:hypothetical protein